MSFKGFPGGSDSKKSTWNSGDRQKDPLEKGMATPSSILAWRIPWTKKPGGLHIHGISKSQTQLSD